VSVRHYSPSLQDVVLFTLACTLRQADGITSAISVVAQFESTCDVREVDFVQDHDMLVDVVWTMLLVVKVLFKLDHRQ
jgi:hypothetical protein